MSEIVMTHPYRQRKNILQKLNWLPQPIRMSRIQAIKILFNQNSIQAKFLTAVFGHPHFIQTPAHAIVAGIVITCL